MFPLLQPTKSRNLPRRMIIRNLHIQRTPAIPQILRHQHRRLLSNQQRSRVSIAPDVIRTNRQVSDFQTFDAMDIQAFVQDTVFDDGISFLRSHGTGAEGVPCCFDVLNQHHQSYSHQKTGKGREG